MVKFCTTLSLNNIPEKPNKKHTNQQSEANVIKSKKLHQSESIWCFYQDYIDYETIREVSWIGSAKVNNWINLKIKLSPTITKR